MKLIDLTGNTYADLKVLKRSSSNRKGSSKWLCLCSCGKEKVLSSDHLTRKTSPVKSCGCKMTKRGKNHAQWLGCGNISGNWWYHHVLRERKQNERTRVPVTITIEQAWNLFLKQEKKCALSGQSITIGRGPYGTASIDRIDSSRGYEIDNIQWVHKDINFMKRTYSQEYFVDTCKMITAYHSLIQKQI